MQPTIRKTLNNVVKSALSGNHRHYADLKKIAILAFLAAFLTTLWPVILPQMTENVYAAAPIVVHDHGELETEVMDSQSTDPDNPTRIILADDYDGSSGNLSFTVYSGKYAEVDLNGNDIIVNSTDLKGNLTLKGSGTITYTGTSVILVTGCLTIDMDDENGVITGFTNVSFTDEYWGCFFIGGGYGSVGSIILKSGTISYTGTNPVVSVNDDDSSLNMSGGTIVNNGTGDAVDLSLSSGSFTQSGGTVIGHIDDPNNGYTYEGGVNENHVAITFDPGDGTGTMTPQYAETGTSPQIKANTFTYEGHIFAGWLDENNNPYTDEGYIRNIQRSYALTARWEVPVDEVKVSPTSKTLNIGDTLQLTATVLPDTASLKDVIWNSDDEDIATVEDGLVTATGPGTTAIKALAVYDNDKYATCEITVNADRVATPTFSPDPKTYDNAQSVTIKCATDGATIYYTTDGSEPAKNKGTKYTSPITVDKTTIIKAIAVKERMKDSEVAAAKYTIEEPQTEYWTVTFDPNANDASGKMDPQKIEKGKEGKLDANRFTRKGFTFKNWNTKKDGSGKKYADKGSFKPQANTTLYAQWKAKEAKKYTVTVNADPAKGGTATASVGSGKSGKEVTLKAVSKAGYEFKKWKVISGGVELADASKAKTTFKIKKANVKVKALFEKIYEEPQPEIASVDDDKIVLAWFTVDEAEGYDIFMSRCFHEGKDVTPKKIKTIKDGKTNKWTVSGLEPEESYKAYIKAFTRDKNGKKKYISESPLMHIYTSGGNEWYTNAKSVKLDTSDGKIKKSKKSYKLTLNVKDTYKIKASVKKLDERKKLMPKSHVKTLRYLSSDPGVASVSGKGKITAWKKGKCKIYVFAHNGVSKTIKLTVE